MMDAMERSGHWNEVYRSRDVDRLSWYEADPVTSRRLVRHALVAGARSLIDIGGGASLLVDHLLEADLDRIAVLDVAEGSIRIAQARLGDAASRVEWIVQDIIDLGDVGMFDVWHDRAVFHFLTDPADRARYVRAAERTLRPGGTAIVATFAPDGPERCSGLPVCRYDAEDLAAALGLGFELLTAERHVHETPLGQVQPFTYAAFRRLG